MRVLGAPYRHLTGAFDSPCRHERKPAFPKGGGPPPPSRVGGAGARALCVRALRERAPKAPDVGDGEVCLPGRSGTSGAATQGGSAKGVDTLVRGGWGYGGGYGESRVGPATAESGPLVRRDSGGYMGGGVPGRAHQRGTLGQHGASWTRGADRSGGVYRQCPLCNNS